MAAFTKRKTKFHLQLTNSDQATAHGGQVLVDALARRFGLWKRIQEESQLEVRKRLGAGFSPAIRSSSKRRAGYWIFTKVAGKESPWAATIT